MRFVLPVFVTCLLCVAPVMAVAQTPPNIQLAAAQGPAAPGTEPAEGINTADIFGFTSGSDTDTAGTLSGGLEFNGDFARRQGRYTAIGTKLGLTYAVTDNFATTFNLFSGYRDIRNSPELANTRSLRFDGIGTEFRLRLVERGPSPVGITLQVEPSLRTASGETGQRGIGGGMENKLIIDTALVPEKVFAAINLIYDFESFKPNHEPTERGSGFGVSGALAVQVAPQVFLGGELRYMRAYDGLGLNRFQGDALFLGPTLFWQAAQNVSVAGTFSAQVAGRAVEDNRNLDLLHFNRYQARVKVGVEF